MLPVEVSQRKSKKILSIILFGFVCLCSCTRCIMGFLIRDFVVIFRCPSKLFFDVLLHGK